MAGRASSWCPWPCLCSFPPENKDAQVSAWQVPLRNHRSSRRGGCSPTLFLQGLPFGTPDSRPLLDTDSGPSPPDPWSEQLCPSSWSRAASTPRLGPFLPARWDPPLPQGHPGGQSGALQSLLEGWATERAALRDCSLSTRPPAALPQGPWAKHGTVKGVLSTDLSCGNWGQGPRLRARWL